MTIQEKIAYLEEKLGLTEKKKAKRKKKKPYDSVTYTTGDQQLNIDHFNKALSGGKDVKTDGILNGTFKNSGAENAAKAVGTFASASPDGASSVSLGGGESSGGEGMGEALDKTLKVNNPGVPEWFIEDWD